jgi:hypothetical protein
MCLFEKEETNTFSQGGTYDQYRQPFGKNPDDFGVQPSTPCWFGEVVLISSYLRTRGILSKITEQVRFARKRFGRYEGAT